MRKSICVDQGQKESSQKKIIAKTDVSLHMQTDGIGHDTNLMWAAMDIGANINWYNAKKLLRELSRRRVYRLAYADAE